MKRTKDPASPPREEDRVVSPKILWLLGLLLLSVVVACARDAGDEPATEVAAPATSPATATAAPPTATPTTAPTATPTATPTPLRPTITAIEQAVDEDGTVFISDITLPESGWVVVYADDAGELGDPLGYSAVESGSSQDIPVTIDPYLATDPLHARLHTDAGEPGTFEFPGPDEPLAPEEATSATFAVDMRVAVPALTVDDQEITEEQSQVVVDAVSAPAPAWVVLYADADGEPGKVLGQTPVQEGANEDVVIDFDWRQATRLLHLRLYEDAGEPGRFEPATADQPIAIAGTPVSATFQATLPIDVFVVNQPGSTGEIYVERAVVNSPGWLAVYSDFSGYGDLLLGYVPLEPGVNEELVVPIGDGGITPLLHIMLHEDLGTVGEFESPGPDVALRDEGRMLLFSFQTDAGTYLQTVDQALDGDEVTVPLVVADIDSWLVIHADEDGELGEIIGRTPLTPGVHRDVAVSIDPEAATPLVHAALYEDAEPLGEFEPEGEDTILRFGSDFTQAPFALVSVE